jgi:hypothetical protein
MKTLLLLGCVFCLGACGSGGNGTGTYQAPAQTNNASQTPQTPSDSVPAVNSQSPAFNEQAPPLNSQQPRLAASGSTIDCTVVAAVAHDADCQISDAQMSICLSLTEAGAPCATQVQSLLSCVIEQVACDGGALRFNEGCSDELDGLGACFGTQPSTSSCSPSSLCLVGCTDACAACQCGLQLNPSAGDSCTQECVNM